MKLLLVKVNNDFQKKTTPVMVIAPDVYTQEQVAGTIHLEYLNFDENDRYSFTISEMGSIDASYMDENDLALFDAFFPDQWHGMY